jgi:hypothetical protein
MYDHRYFSIEQPPSEEFESAESLSRIARKSLSHTASAIAVGPSKLLDLPLHRRPTYECADITYSVPGPGYTVTIRVDERDARTLIEELLARFPELFATLGR